MTRTECRECQQEVAAGAKTCDNCGAFVNRRPPLVNFGYLYVIGGIAFIGIYGALFDRQVALSVAWIWLAVGAALALIIYGRARRHVSDSAGLVYLVGLALLVIFLLVGAAQWWNADIDLQSLQWWQD